MKKYALPVLATVVAVAGGVGLIGAAFSDPGQHVPVAGRPQPRASAGSYGLPLGATMTAGGGSSVQDGTIRSAKTFRQPCGQFFPDPEKGVYLVVDVTVAQRAGLGSVNPLDFRFVGADGATADSISGTFSGCGRSTLDSTNELRTGQKRCGQIVFDVPSATGSIEWAPGGVYADTVGSWRIR